MQRVPPQVRRSVSFCFSPRRVEAHRVYFWPRGWVRGRTREQQLVGSGRVVQKTQLAGVRCVVRQGLERARSVVQLPRRRAPRERRGGDQRAVHGALGRLLLGVASLGRRRCVVRGDVRPRAADDGVRPRAADDGVRRRTTDREPQTTEFEHQFVALKSHLGPKPTFINMSKNTSDHDNIDLAPLSNRSPFFLRTAQKDCAVFPPYCCAVHR